MLLERRRTETGRNRAAKGEGVVEVIARGDLAGAGRTKVRIVFVADGDIDGEGLGHLRVQISIEAEGVA